MRTIPAFLALVLVFSIATMCRQITFAEQEPPKQVESGKPCAGTTSGEKVVEIPLKEIWALDMPGTRPLSELPYQRVMKTSQPSKPTESSVEYWSRKIHLRLARRNHSAEPLPGLAVPTKERWMALMGAVSGFSHPETLKEYLTSDVELSLFFFAHPCAYRVEIERVEVIGNVFDIHYRFVPQYTSEAADQFAVIPVGKLAAGEYKVKLTQLPLEQKYLVAGFKPVTAEAAARIVCRPFTFKVIEPLQEHKIAENATRIPLKDILAWKMPGTQSLQKLTRSSPEAYELLSNIFKKLSRPPQDETALPGFAVEGVGLKALKNTQEFLKRETRIAPLFSSEKELSLVFFTHLFGAYIHIHEVAIDGNTIIIKYRPVPHQTREVTRHLAIIPVGKRPKGTTIVRIERSPMEQYYLNRGSHEDRSKWQTRIVCGSFSFDVR